MENRRCGLRYPYLSVKAQTGDSFGGNQNWSAGFMMRRYGCGVVGAGDVLLYLGLHRTECETDLFYGMLREDGLLSLPRYERYLAKLRKRYFPIIPGFGIPGFLLPVSMNRYFRHYRMDFRASWGLRFGQILPRIEAMLRQDIPVILAVGPNFPPFLRKKKVTFYRLENGEYFPAAETAGHFVVVTGIVGEYLQISSWGKEYYIFWPEFQRYVKKCSSFFASNICRIREKKKRNKGK